MSNADQDRIEKVVDLPVPVSRVWRALTDHEAFGEWFRVALDGPFKVGTVTTGRMTFPGAEHVEWQSLTEKMDHETLFSFSWHPNALDSETNYEEGAKVIVEFRLQAIETGTRLNIVETGFLQFPDSKRLDILRSNQQGWDIQATHIADYLDD
ncbi:MAG: SRPBCC family protein [Pseudomonadota bacterium]